MKTLSYIKALAVSVFLLSCNRTNKTADENLVSTFDDSVKKSLDLMKPTDSLVTYCFAPFNGDQTLSSRQHNFDFQQTQHGFDAYFEHAEVQLSWVKDSDLPEDKNVLKIQFDLPPSLDWGNWLSIRKDFKDIQNLENFSGVVVRLKVLDFKPGLFLRITMTDIIQRNFQEDEFWWYDVENKILKSTIGQWIEIKIPFDKFGLSYGIGSQYNDGIFNKNSITSYEMNFVSESGKHPSGTILVESIYAYK